MDFKIFSYFFYSGEHYLQVLKILANWSEITNSFDLFGISVKILAECHLYFGQNSSS